MRNVSLFLRRDPSWRPAWGWGLPLRWLDCSTRDAGAGWEGGCEPDGGAVCLLRGWRHALVSGFLGDIYDAGEDFRRGRGPVPIPTPPLAFGVTQRRCSRSLDLSFFIRQTGIVSTKSNEVTKSVTHSRPSKSVNCCLLLVCRTPGSIVASVGLREWLPSVTFIFPLHKLLTET